MADNEQVETVTALTWAQIQKQIDEEAADDDIEIAELPRTTDAIWVARYDAMEIQTQLTIRSSAPSWAKLKDSEREAAVKGMLDEMTPMRIGRGRPWPLNPGYVVMYVFKDADELRVYTVPASSFVTGTREAPVAATPTPIGMRYSINRANPKPVFTAEAIMIDVWISEVVRECIELDGEVNVEENSFQEGADEERAKTIAFIKTLKPEYALSDLLADLSEGVHENVELPEEEEEEEEEEEKENEEEDDAVAANGQAKPSAASTEPTRPLNEPATPAE